jgi:uncharacterized protein
VNEDAELQRAIRDACFAETPELGALPPRIAIYRRLVRNTLEGVVFKLLPRTREHMGEAFDASFARFLEEHAPRTHYLRDVPLEFVRWATDRWRDEGAPAWLVDLARHEVTSFAVSTVPHVEEPRAEEVSIERALLFSSLVRIERYAHAIHEDAVPPPARVVALLYFRNDAHELDTLELSPLAAALLERADRVPLREAIATACAETGVPMNDETLASIARLLADLGARGILLGAR